MQKINVNSPGFQAMADQFAHGCGGAAFTYTVALLAGHYFLWFLLAFIAVFPIYKEMFFDPAEETGGQGTNAKKGRPDFLDMFFYFLGIDAALIVLQIHGHIILWPHF